MKRRLVLACPAGIQGMIMGDTTRAILRRIPCPVVVVPPLSERR